MPGVRQVNFNTQILSNVSVCVCVCSSSLRWQVSHKHRSLYNPFMCVCFILQPTLWELKSSAALFSLFLSFFALLCPFLVNSEWNEWNFSLFLFFSLALSFTFQSFDSHLHPSKDYIRETIIHLTCVTVSQRGSFKKYNNFSLSFISFNYTSCVTLWLTEEENVPKSTESEKERKNREKEREKKREREVVSCEREIKKNKREQGKECS